MLQSWKTPHTAIAGSVDPPLTTFRVAPLIRRVNPPAMFGACAKLDVVAPAKPERSRDNYLFPALAATAPQAAGKKLRPAMFASIRLQQLVADANLGEHPLGEGSSLRDLLQTST